MSADTRWRALWTKEVRPARIRKVATLQYGPLSFDLPEGRFDHLLADLGLGVDDLGEDPLALLMRRLIEEIIKSGEPRFLPLPMTFDDGTSGRTSILIAPGIPIAILGSGSAEHATSALEKVATTVFGTNRE